MGKCPNYPWITHICGYSHVPTARGILHTVAALSSYHLPSPPLLPCLPSDAAGCPQAGAAIIMLAFGESFL